MTIDYDDSIIEVIEMTFYIMMMAVEKSLDYIRHRESSL